MQRELYKLIANNQMLMQMTN